MPEITSLGLREYPLVGQEAEPKKKGFWEKRIPQRLKEKVAAGMMLGMTLLGPNSVEPQTIKGGIKKETALSETKERDWGIHWTLTAKDEDGRIYINPFGILPQVEVFSETKETKETKFELPYEYSRLFDTGKPLSSEDHQKLAEYIEGKLREEFGTQLHDLLGSDDIFRAKHGDSIEKVKITKIQVTGFASPEGPQSKGSSTLAPGSVDVENLGLAKKRAEIGAMLTEEALQKLGITREQLDVTIGSVGAEELQPSDEEMVELEGLAMGENGADPLEKIFNLTIKYNDGTISDAATKEALDRIIGSKRKVEVTITYEDGQKDVYLFMIPWIVLLPLLRRRRKTSEPAPVPPSKEPLRLPGQVIPPKFKEVNLPDPNSEEYKDMEERSAIDDLYVHFGNPDTIRRGLDYQAMVDNLYFQYDEFKDDAEREEFLAAKILQGWKDHDRAARKEAGVGEDQLDAGLDYENQDNQIKWAKMHAKKLAKIVKQKKEFEAQGKEYSYMELMTPEAARLLKRRNGESELGAPAELGIEEAVVPKIEVAEKKESRSQKYIEALKKKRDTLRAYFAMNAVRAGKKLSELSAEAVAKYKELKDAWLKRREEFSQAIYELSAEEQEKLAQEDLAGETEIEPQTPEPESKPTEPVRETRPERELNLTLERQRASAGWTEAGLGYDIRDKVKESYESAKSGLGKSADYLKSKYRSAKEYMQEKTSGLWGWLKERGKGVASFGIWEFHQAEKFRSKTREVAEDVRSLSTLIQGEMNLNPGEAEDEAWEIVKKLREKGTDIYDAEEFANASKDITLRKAKENGEEIEYIIKSAKEDLREKLGVGKGAFKEYKGEAGQKMLSPEDEKKFEDALRFEMNKVRIRKGGEDMVTFAKLMRQNLDENWKWRYVWGTAEAALWVAGIAWWTMSKEAATAVAGAGTETAAEQTFTQAMNQNIWTTLKEMAQNGPQHLNLDNSTLQELSQKVLDANKMFEPEWVKGAVEGLRSSRTLPQGMPLQIPLEVMKVLGF